VLDSFLEGISRERVSANQEQIAQWRELRNNAAHPGSHKPTVDRATEMIRGVRNVLTRDLRLVEDVRPAQDTAEPRQVRGKYKFVPTSSAAFIERKADELRLEH
jgi:hypothetical protein